MKPFNLLILNLSASQSCGSTGLAFQFMATSKPSSLNHIQPMLFVADFPAKILVTRAKERVYYMVRGRAFSMSLCESFAWLDHDTSSWKTSQLSLTEDSTLFSKKWPKQGMMQNGHVFEHLMWVPVTAVTAGGALPTPTARDYKDAGPNVNYKKAAKKSRLPGVVVTSLNAIGEATYLNPSFVEEMMGYPAGYTDLKL